MSKLIKIISSIGAILAAIFSIFMIGKKSGINAEKLNTLQQDNKDLAEVMTNVKKNNKIDEDTSRLSDDDIINELRKSVQD